MKPTEQAVKDAAIEKSIFCHGDKPTEGRVHFRVGFETGAQWAISQMQTEWVAINTKSDLPDKSCEMWVFDEPSQKVVRGSFMASKEHYDYWLANATHYIIIEEPQPPTK